jgi:hypothetical protein
MPDQTLTLKKPIKAHNEEVTVLTFREPTTEDIMKCGYPTFLKSDGGKGMQIGVDAAVTGALICELCGIPMSSVKSLHYTDFNKAGAIVADFFKDSIAGLS